MVLVDAAPGPVQERWQIYRENIWIMSVIAIAQIYLGTALNYFPSLNHISLPDGSDSCQVDTNHI